MRCPNCMCKTCVPTSLKLQKKRLTGRPTRHLKAFKLQKKFTKGGHLIKTNNTWNMPTILFLVEKNGGGATLPTNTEKGRAGKPRINHVDLPSEESVGGKMCMLPDHGPFM